MIWDYKVKVRISQLYYGKNPLLVSNDLRDHFHAQIFGKERGPTILKSMQSYIAPSGSIELEVSNEDADIFIQKLQLGNDSTDTDVLEIQIANLPQSVRNRIKAEQDITISLGAGIGQFELIDVFDGKISRVEHHHNRPDIITMIWAQPAVANFLRLSIPQTINIAVGRKIAGHIVTYFELIKLFLSA
ncbi:MAG TPA: hypothetical protein EYP30_03155, partial [Archaeoglobaceae archaeon]|nr:hypothetical protein [Archaeoglobaceae archaeon]